MVRREGLEPPVVCVLVFYFLQIMITSLNILNRYIITSGQQSACVYLFRHPRINLEPALRNQTQLTSVPGRCINQQCFAGVIWLGRPELNRGLHPLEDGMLRTALRPINLVRPVGFEPTRVWHLKPVAVPIYINHGRIKVGAPSETRTRTPFGTGT